MANQKNGSDNQICSKKLIHSVKEIRMEEDIKKVNSLIKENWILLLIVPNEKTIQYVIGRI